MNVRPLRPGDEDAWRDLWTAYLAFYDTTLPEATFATTFARLTDPAIADVHAIVAETDGRLTGLVHYLFHAHNWHPEGICYLQDLYTAPEARGTGQGRALIEAVYAAADDAGRPRVYWLTQDHNATARRLYDRVATVTPFVKYQR